MAVRAKNAVKNPYGDDKGFGAPSARRKAAAASETRSAHKITKAKHFVRLVMDDNGNLQTDYSPNMSSYAAQILSRDVCDKFREACQRIEAGQSTDPPLGKQLAGDVSTGQKRNSKKRRKVDHDSGDLCQDTPSTAASEAFPRSGKTMSICIGDRDAVLRYYATCLRAFQQINCRTICKLWIKLIHPKKQVTHPYNGTVKLPEGTIKDSDKTKPRWWAAHVRHKEPDHLKKDERIDLMVHLIDQCVRENNHFEQQITVEQLFEEVAKKKGELNGGPNKDQMGRLKLIRDICDLRTVQQRWEEGCLDDDTMVPVESHEEHAKKAERDEAIRESKLAAEQKVKEGKVSVTLEPLELREDHPVLTPTSPATSPGIYPPAFAVHDREAHHRNTHCQSTVGPYSPQSMSSFNSMSGSPSFHEIHSMQQQTMVFPQQSGYNATGMDQSPEHMGALNGGFVPMARSDSLAPWTPHVPSTESFITHVNGFPQESASAASMHGLQMDHMAFNSSQYTTQSHDDAATALNCFQPVNPLDPRQMAFEWKYRSMT